MNVKPLEATFLCTFECLAIDLIHMEILSRWLDHLTHCGDHKILFPSTSWSSCYSSTLSVCNFIHYPPPVFILRIINHHSPAAIQIPPIKRRGTVPDTELTRTGVQWTRLHVTPLSSCLSVAEQCTVRSISKSKAGGTHGGSHNSPFFPFAKFLFFFALPRPLPPLPESLSGP
jgi:hypothetical protein